MRGSGKGPTVDRDYSVYISCPYRPEFQNLRHGLMLAAIASGHQPVCDFDNPFPSEPHVPNVADGLARCRYSIHNCSCSDTQNPNEFGRFNIPIELGMALLERHRTHEKADFHEVYIQLPERHSYLQFLIRLNSGFANSYSSEFDAIRKALLWLINKPTCSTRPPMRDFRQAWETLLTDRPNMTSTNGIDDEIRQDELHDLAISICRRHSWWRDPPWMRFDLFLAYNWEDQQAVQVVATKLKSIGLKPWMDIDQVAPGTSFVEQIGAAIPRSNAAAIFIGEKGIGRWQKAELDTCLITSAEENIPVIPVLLPSTIVQELPPLLRRFRCVTFTALENERAIEELVWGAKGRRS
jgi:hypothetical protein